MHLLYVMTHKAHSVYLLYHLYVVTAKVLCVPILCGDTEGTLRVPITCGDTEGTLCVPII